MALSRSVAKASSIVARLDMYMSLAARNSSSCTLLEWAQGQIIQIKVMDVNQN
jgi:hypothetical protein